MDNPFGRRYTPNGRDISAALIAGRERSAQSDRDWGACEGHENSRWEELDQIAPTVPDLGKRIQLTAMEQAILRYLPYLEEAFARPKAYLKTETARVYVSQARRIPARAISYLAAHTEDWERPTLRSVRPKRVLAEVREDELDIYENRVAVRLVDRLLRVVQPRILELRKAQRILSDLLDYSTSAGGSHWRAGRICSLWAESVSALQSEKRSRTTLEKLVSIRQRLRALLDSPLYRTISRRADVADELKLTNILATDPIYKHIAILWLAWGGKSPVGRSQLVTCSPNTGLSAMRSTGSACFWSCELCRSLAFPSMKVMLEHRSALGAPFGCPDQIFVCRLWRMGLFNSTGVQNRA